jgi:hypothetical protein
MNWREFVRSRLLAMKPANVWAMDPDALALCAQVLPGTRVSLDDRTPDKTFALALGVRALEHLSPERAQQRIHEIRLYTAPRLLLVEPTAGMLDAATFRALGFMFDATDADEQLNVYAYDLDTYKSVPDWLNPRYWAHPERWKP